MNAKRLLFAIAVVLVFALPFTALARMSSITDDDMEDIRGQTGLLIDLTFHVNDSYLSWEDDDGFGTTAYQNPGCLTIAGIMIDSDGAGGDLTLEGLGVQQGSTAAGVNYIVIGLPDMDGWITYSSFKIGSAPKLGGGFGSIVIGDLETRNSRLLLTTE